MIYMLFAEVHAQPVRILRVVLDQLLQRAECGPSGDEKAALVQLPYAVVLDRIAVAHWNGKGIKRISDY